MFRIDVTLDFNSITFIFTMLSWVAIGFIAMKIRMKQSVKPSLWKIILVIIAGLFSFSINVNWFGMPLRLAVLPLGVWILFFFLKNKEDRWERYRPLAWLGFWSNYILVAFILLTIPLHQWVYPKDQLSTYLSVAEDPTLISIHPAAKENQVIQPEELLSQLDSMKKDKVFNDEWYTEFYLNTETAERSERFPYQLVGTKPKWGSGLDSMIFIEGDGKGILVTTAERQLYFRTEKSLIRGRGTE